MDCTFKSSTRRLIITNNRFFTIKQTIRRRNIRETFMEDCTKKKKHAGHKRINRMTDNAQSGEKRKTAENDASRSIGACTRAL